MADNDNNNGKDGKTDGENATTEVEDVDGDDALGNLELAEGDVSMVVRTDGEVEFIVLCEDETSEDYVRALVLIQYLKFVMHDKRCKDLFEKSRAVGPQGAN